jgi:DNA polymerase-2
VTDYAHATSSGGKDELLIYRKRLSHRLDAYEINVPPQVRAARMADEYNVRVGRPHAVPEWWLDSVRYHQERA